MSAKTISKSVNHVSPYKKGKIHQADMNRFCVDVCNAKFLKHSEKINKSMSDLAHELLTLAKMPISDEAINTLLEHNAVMPLKGVRVHFRNKYHYKIVTGSASGFIWDYEHFHAKDGVVVSHVLLQKIQSNPGNNENNTDERFSPEMSAKVDDVLNKFAKTREDKAKFIAELMNIVSTLGSWKKVAEHLPETTKWIPLAEGFTHQHLVPVSVVESINNIREGLKGLTDE